MTPSLKQRRIIHTTTLIRYDGSVVLDSNQWETPWVSCFTIFCYLLSRFSEFSLAVWLFVPDISGHTYYHRVPIVLRICLLCLYLPGAFSGALGDYAKAAVMPAPKLSVRDEPDAPKIS